MRKPGWWYPYIFVGMFMVVVAVNGALAYYATSTFNGLTTNTAFEEGVTYNRTLAAAAAQDKLGWSVATEFDPAAVTGGGGVAATFTGPDGQPLNGLDVLVVFTRPTQSGYDTRVVMRNPGDGRYIGDVALPLRGVWDVQVVASRGTDNFQHRERVVLR